MSGPPPTKTATVGSVLRVLLREHRWEAIALMVGASAAAMAESGLLALVAHAATALVDGDDRASASFGPVTVDASIGTLLAVAAAFGVIRLVLQVALAYLPARMIAASQERMRNRVFDAYSQATWELQANERDGQLQELLTGQVNQATNAVLFASQLVSTGFTAATLVLAAVGLSPIVAVIVLVVGAVLMAGLRPLGKRGRLYSSRLSAAQVSFAGTLASATRLAEETYVYGVDGAERERLHAESAIVRGHLTAMQFMTRLTQGLFQGLVLLLVVGGLAVIHAADTAPIASLGGVVLILVRASAYGQQAQGAWHAIQQAGPFIERLEGAEQQYRANARTSGDRPYPPGSAVRFESVSFAYRADRPVLREVDLEVQPGEVIGIVGPSGSGKSTLTQLLLRMRPPTAGRLVLGDTDFEEISLDDWRRLVAYVPQEARLLHASVRDNIRFLRDLSPEAVERAARLAGIHDDIVAMPDGYDTVIGQRADAVSGGQRQRICLARALAGEPEILVLDEPTSALDATSEVLIRTSLAGLRGDFTMFIVTHRTALLEICDRVVQVEHGVARPHAAR